MLNAISAVGLLTMILLAWLMSSHKTKVDWRLVVLGVMLQLVLAGVFFNSQNWKFPREFTDLPSLIEASEKNGYEPSAVPTPEGAENFAELFKEHLAVVEKGRELEKAGIAFNDDEDSLENFQQRYWAKTNDSVVVPRFKNGVVFWCVESFFDVIQSSVEAGSSFVFNIYPEPDDTPVTHQKRCCDRLRLVFCRRSSFSLL